GYDRAPVVELAQLLVCQGRTHVRADVEPCQGTHAVDAAGIAIRTVVGELQVGPGLSGLAEIVLVVDRVEMIGEGLSLAIDQANQAAVVLPAAIRAHKAHKQSGKVAKALHFVPVVVQEPLEPAQGALGHGASLGKALADLLTSLL